MGFSVGIAVGRNVGFTVGIAVGFIVGVEDGFGVGLKVGAADGFGVGGMMGFAVGFATGDRLALNIGDWLGLEVWTPSVGEMIGIALLCNPPSDCKVCNVADEEPATGQMSRS